MIRVWNVMEAVASAILASGDVQSICAPYKAGLSVLLGYSGEAHLCGDGEGPVVSILGSDQPVDLGYSGEATRDVPVVLRWRVFDKSAHVDGDVTRYIAAQTAHELGDAMIDAIRGITGLGDELKQAQVIIDASEWPDVTGEANLVFALSRGLAMEPEVT